MKQKRQTAGMVQANDLRVGSAKRPISGSRSRELHGYDGPMQFLMSPVNPDQVIPLQTNRISTYDDVKRWRSCQFCSETAKTKENRRNETEEEREARLQNQRTRMSTLRSGKSEERKENKSIEESRILKII
ncbi:Protein king tubby [Eumeta japonica]|uniref:Protein king tubby n=1 Tax=Eumeta variegata TaxID=151549 RepID=A0A4C1W4H3_EUMVA|nr:Protein king tubby [Eumeta japonica]